MSVLLDKVQGGFRNGECGVDLGEYLVSYLHLTVFEFEIETSAKAKKIRPIFGLCKEERGENLIRIIAGLVEYHFSKDGTERAVRSLSENVDAHYTLCRKNVDSR